MAESFLLSNCNLSLLTQEVLHFYEKNDFKPLFPREIDEDIYTKPPKDDTERTERLQHPRKLRTRLMFCDLLEE